MSLHYLVGQQLVAELAFSVKAVAVARTGTAGAARSLVRVGLRDRGDVERVHADLGVVDLGAKGIGW